MSPWISAKAFNKYWSQRVYSKERYSGTELKEQKTFDGVWVKTWSGDIAQILREEYNIRQDLRLRDKA